MSLKDALMGSLGGQQQQPALLPYPGLMSLSKMQKYAQFTAMYGGPPSILGFDKAKTPSLPHRTTTQVFTCWRWWRCVMQDGEPFLQSTYKDTLWEGPIQRSNDRPEVDNQEGFHGFFPLSSLEHGADEVARISVSFFKDRMTATIYYPIGGEIELFGRCIVHEKGVRGERVRVKRLLVYPRFMPFCRPETITALGNRYDCSAEVGVYCDPSQHGLEP